MNEYMASGGIAAVADRIANARLSTTSQLPSEDTASSDTYHTTPEHAIASSDDVFDNWSGANSSSAYGSGDGISFLLPLPESYEARIRRQEAEVLERAEQNYFLLRQLGMGSEAYAFAALPRRGLRRDLPLRSQLVCVKAIYDQSAANNLNREIDALRRLKAFQAASRCDNVSTFLDSRHDDSVIAFPLYEAGSLAGMFECHRRFPPSLLCSLFSDLAGALGWLASCAVAHRDLWHANVLVDLSRPGATGLPRFVLNDWGRASWVGDALDVTRDELDTLHRLDTQALGDLFSHLTHDAPDARAPARLRDGRCCAAPDGECPRRRYYGWNGGAVAAHFNDFLDELFRLTARGRSASAEQLLDTLGHWAQVLLHEGLGDVKERFKVSGLRNSWRLREFSEERIREVLEVEHGQRFGEEGEADVRGANGDINGDVAGR